MSDAGIVLVIDDQPEVRRLLAELFHHRGREVTAFASGEEGIDFVRAHAGHAALAILDLDLGPGQRNGTEICAELSALDPELPIIILTGHASIDRAVAAMRAGAADFLVKDVYLEDKIDLSVEKIERMMAYAREHRRLEDELLALRLATERLRESVGQRWQIVGASEALAKVVAKVERVARLPRPVLVLGERGTGKELCARAIHHLSPRQTDPFVTINCAAVSESLLESELFGHEEGAFTGATRQKEGKFELADGGTL
ncbi:MAG TPA: sigma 54-interacting transcriptional regulator, partial [Kofleriaceae bacterium]|nr:sigma 54-interacting transcriptional regulator [Kofleriaceae bacterium]